MRVLGLIVLLGVGCDAKVEKASEFMADLRLCPETEKVEARVSSLLAQGRLDRARRLLDQALEECPQDGRHLTPLLESVKAQLDEPGTPADLIREAEEAERRGEPEVARRLYDRALHRLDESEVELRLEVDVQRAPSLVGLSWSPDSQEVFMLGASRVTRVRVADASTVTFPAGGKLGDGEEGAALTFSRDGRFFAAVRADGTVGVWENAAAAPIMRWDLKPKRPAASAAIDSRGRVFLVRRSDDDDPNEPVDLEVWQDGSLAAAHATSVGTIWGLGLSRDERRLVVRSSWSTIAFSIDPFKELSSIPGNHGGTSAWTSSSDGGQVASLMYSMGLILSFAGGADINTPLGGDCSNHATDVLFLDDDRTVAARPGAGAFGYVNAATGRRIAARPAPPAGIDLSRFSMQTPSPRGHRLAYLHDHAVHVTDGDHITSLDSGYDVSAFGFSPDGTRIVALDSTGVTVWDAKTGTRLFEQREPQRAEALQSADVSDDGTTMAALTHDGRVHLWTRAGLDISRQRWSAGGGRRIEVSAGGERVAVFASASVAIWEGAKKVATYPIAASGQHLAVSPDLRRVIELEDGTLRVHGDRFAHLPTAKPDSAAVSFDSTGGWVAVMSAAGETTLVDVRSGKERRSMCGDGQDNRLLAVSEEFVAVGSPIDHENAPDGCGSLVHNEFGVRCGRVRICSADGGRVVLEDVVHWSTAESTALRGVFHGDTLTVGGAHFTHRYARRGEEWKSDIVLASPNKEIRETRRTGTGEILYVTDTQLEIYREGNFVAALSWSPNSDGAFATDAEGHLERFGSAALPTHCAGTRKSETVTYPAGLCSERFEVTGLWARFLAGE